MTAEQNKCNPAEAPAGYYAIPKASAAIETGGSNICRACHWRPQCNDENTDFFAYGHRCMGYAIVAFHDGKTYQREDGASVVFKRVPLDIKPTKEPEQGQLF